MAVARSCTCTTLTITITSTSSTPVTVAVDVNGADLGPAEVARGAAHAENVRVILFGPAAEIGPVPAHVSVVDAPVSIAKEADPARAVRRTPEASIVRAVAAAHRAALVATQGPDGGLAITVTFRNDGETGLSGRS